MRGQLHRHPQVESLESMTLLSGASAGIHGAAAAMVDTMRATPIVNHEIDLHGTAHGRYNAHVANPDVGKTYDFSGSGQVTPLGHVNLTGNVHTLGFIAQGHATGQLVLSNSRGSLTLALTGPEQRGFSPIPDHFTFQITNATGRFQGKTGSGVVALALNPGKASPTATPGLPTEQGHFTMVFISLPSPRVGSGTAPTA